MTVTNLRLEWRSFGQRFGVAEGRLEKLTSTGVRESDEIRPVDPDMVDPELRHSQSFKIELDVMPDGYV